MFYTPVFEEILSHLWLYDPKLVYTPFCNLCLKQAFFYIYISNCKSASDYIYMKKCKKVISYTQNLINQESIVN